MDSTLATSRVAASRSSPRMCWSRWFAYGSVPVGVGAALALTYALLPLHYTPTVLFFAAIAVAAWLGGRGPALLATLLSTVAVDFFFVSPHFVILSSLADLTRVLAFALVAALICYLQEKYQRSAGQLQLANEQLEERVRARTADLVASLKEKDVLLRELHHRVKNNLQMISSFLSLQSRNFQDQGARQKFKECQDRVRTMALVHERLCAATNLAWIDLAEYFRSLIDNLCRSYGVRPDAVTARVVVDDTHLDIDHIIPCALIVNELLSNSLKHAFPAGQPGQLRIELRHEAAEVRLTVADNGIGLPASALADQGLAEQGDGLQIVRALVDQLAGRLEIDNGVGASVRVTFPERD